MTAQLLLATEFDLGDRMAPLEARVNRRAKRLIVRVDSLSGVIHITIPSKRSLPAALSFARERAGWIREELNSGPRAQPFAPGGLCPYRAHNHIIVRDGGPRSPVRQVSADDENLLPRLMVGGETAHLNRRLTDWLKRQAAARLAERTDAYCARLGVERGRIRIVDTRSRWGSCSESGTLSFSWRLILAPDHILDYVAAHECTHLVHMNHSRAYWRLLATLGVDAHASRDWFQRHGPMLFAHGVENDG